MSRFSIPAGSALMPDDGSAAPTPGSSTRAPRAVRGSKASAPNPGGQPQAPAGAAQPRSSGQHIYGLKFNPAMLDHVTAVSAQHGFSRGEAVLRIVHRQLRRVTEHHQTASVIPERKPGERKTRGRPVDYRVEHGFTLNVAMNTVQRQAFEALKADLEKESGRAVVNRTVVAVAVEADMRAGVAVRYAPADRAEALDRPAGAPAEEPTDTVDITDPPPPLTNQASGLPVETSPATTKASGRTDNISRVLQSGPSGN